MAKNRIVILGFIILLSAGFPQKAAAQVSHTISVAPVVVGGQLKYELGLSDSFSLLLEGWYNWLSGWGALGHARVYPAGGFFIDVGVGYGAIYNLLDMLGGGLDKAENGESSDKYNNSMIAPAVLLSPTIGYKIVFGEGGAGFVLEPCVGAEIGFGNGLEERSGVCVNLDLKLAFGLKF